MIWVEGQLLNDLATQAPQELNFRLCLLLIHYIENSCMWLRGNVIDSSEILISGRLIFHHPGHYLQMLLKFFPCTRGYSIGFINVNLL